MSQLERLIQNLRQARLFRVLAVYAGASYLVLEAVGLFVEQIGLPDWVFPSALVMLALGFPVVVATAVIQGRKEPAPEAAPGQSEDIAVQVPTPLARHWLTWRKVVLVGVLAFALLGAATTGYMAMRTLGIGPAGSLLAKGLLEERDRIVLADFENHTPDSLLAMVAKNLFSTALSQSRSVRVMSEEEVAEVLKRMRRKTDTPLDVDVAREVAIREGVKAVIDGEVVSVGSAFVVSARLIIAETGEELWADSESAPTADEVVPAVDRLSRKLRERIGETLKTVSATEPLGLSTTSSLEALKKFYQANNAHLDGDLTKALALFQDAVRLDTTFAFAFMGIGLVRQQLGDPRSLWSPAMSKAYLEEQLSVPTSITAAYMRISPDYDPLRDHPRFQALLTNYDKAR